MPGRPGGNFLELWVGPYLLALRTSSVLGVVDERRTETPFVFRERTVPFVDLLQLLVPQAPPNRARVAYTVTLDTYSGWVGLGVDRVSHIPATVAPVLTRLPPFGVQQTHLFEGALRTSQRLLLVLDAESLALYMAQRMGAAFTG